MPLHETTKSERAVLAQVICGRRDLAEAADSLLELGHTGILRCVGLFATT